jgi:hypothetical protein
MRQQRAPAFKALPEFDTLLSAVVAIATPASEARREGEALRMKSPDQVLVSGVLEMPLCPIHSHLALAQVRIVHLHDR